VAFSENGCFLAAGLKEGTIVVWDLMIDAEKCYLDKHAKEVTQMGFFENWKLISGSLDGVVHIYDI
jgi:WD40 repeat protein